MYVICSMQKYMINHYVKKKKKTKFVILTDLLLVLPPRRVERLNECSGVPHKHGVTGCAHNHAEDGQPDVCHAHWGVHAIPNA